MGIEFIPGEPKISKIYKKAITGDHDAIKAICDYYDKKDRCRKALEWFVFGASYGYNDFVELVCLQVILLQADYPKNQREDLLLLGLYWANKLKDRHENYKELEYAKRIITAIQGMLVKNRYYPLTDVEKYESKHIPKI